MYSKPWMIKFLIYLNKGACIFCACLGLAEFVFSYIYYSTSGVSGSRALTIGCEKVKEETEAKNIENGDISFGSNAVIMAVCLYNSIV